MTDERWTPETEKLVEDILDRHVYGHGHMASSFTAGDRDNATEQILVALADAGQLMPPLGQRVADTVARQRLLVQQAEAELARHRQVSDTARAAVVELGNKVPGGADWDERVAYRLGLLMVAVKVLDAEGEVTQ